MKIGKLLVVFIVGLLLVGSALAYNVDVDELTFVITPFDEGGSVSFNTDFDYRFDFTNQADCTDVLLSVDEVVTTNDYGWGTITLDLSDLDVVPTYVCEYLGGVLNHVRTLNPNLFDADTLDNLSCTSDQIVIYNGTEWVCDDQVVDTTLSQSEIEALGFIRNDTDARLNELTVIDPLVVGSGDFTDSLTFYGFPAFGNWTIKPDEIIGGVGLFHNSVVPVLSSNSAGNLQLGDLRYQIKEVAEQPIPDVEPVNHMFKGSAYIDEDLTVGSSYIPGTVLKVNGDLNVTDSAIIGDGSAEEDVFRIKTAFGDIYTMTDHVIGNDLGFVVNDGGERPLISAEMGGDSLFVGEDVLVLDDASNKVAINSFVVDSDYRFSVVDGGVKLGGSTFGDDYLFEAESSLGSIVLKQDDLGDDMSFFLKDGGSEYFLLGREVGQDYTMVGNPQFQVDDYAAKLVMGSGSANGEVLTVNNNLGKLVFGTDIYGGEMGLYVTNNTGVRGYPLMVYPSNPDTVYLADEQFVFDEFDGFTSYQDVTIDGKLYSVDGFYSLTVQDSGAYLGITDFADLAITETETDIRNPEVIMMGDIEGENEETIVTIDSTWGTVTVDNGDTQLNGDLDVTGELTVSQDARFNGDNFYVSSGYSLFDGYIETTGDVYVGGYLSVAEPIYANDNLFVYEDLTVDDGNTTLNGDLNVTGTSTFDDVIFNGEITYNVREGVSAYAYPESGSTTTITTAGEWVAVNNSFNNTKMDGFYFNESIPGIVYNGTNVHTFEIDFHSTVLGDVANTLAQVTVNHNGSILDQWRGENTLKVADTQYLITGTAVVDMYPGDYIQLVTTTDGDGDVLEFDIFTTTIRRFY